MSEKNEPERRELRASGITSIFRIEKIQESNRMTAYVRAMGCEQTGAAAVVRFHGLVTGRRRVLP
ncbi:MAG: hypothetical protein E6J90_08360 [Deltaproteobacteria bacterium]|nr:MAG: hypothetical protein E6J90_08360 [Deltaproteobacteria bacterium]